MPDLKKALELLTRAGVTDTAITQGLADIVYPANGSTKLWNMEDAYEILCIEFDKTRDPKLYLICAKLLAILNDKGKNCRICGHYDHHYSICSLYNKCHFSKRG